MWWEENSNEFFFRTQRRFYIINTYLGTISLNGNHQRDNACVSIDIAELLARDFGFRIGLEEIDKGLQTATHKGRLEFLNGILFDGAHNLAGAKVLRDYLQTTFYNTKFLLVFGAMKDKQITEIAEILFPLAENLILTEPDNPRAATVAELHEIAEKIIDKKKIFTVPNVADAIDWARQISASYPAAKHSLICVTGSLYLVGEVQKVLGEK